MSQDKNLEAALDEEIRAEVERIERCQHAIERAQEKLKLAIASRDALIRLRDRHMPRSNRGATTEAGQAEDPIARSEDAVLRALQVAPRNELGTEDLREQASQLLGRELPRATFYQLLQRHQDRFRQTRRGHWGLATHQGDHMSH